ncbi:MAG: oxidoreductase [Planctomycetaceae bacterium]|nr:oxidoreductase [Planctomycetaceae bacterium]
MAEQRLKFIVLGAGGRGRHFGGWVADHPDCGEVVAVADPDATRRDRLCERCGVAGEMRFESWEAAMAREKFADVVINTTMDQLHAASAVAALDRGYHMLLEKPMATTLADCEAIDAAQRRSGTVVTVCHSLRYHRSWERIKALVDDGVIGELVSFEHLEGVEPIHQSHSFVRGNWGNEGRSTFMLMAKSCHDVDVLAWLVGRRCERVSSFGSLTHFVKANAPKGATAYCLDGCAAERECPYSAMKIYGDDRLWMAGHADLPADRTARVEVLRTSRYGRCVYDCDNDVVDHQVVSFEFEGGVTGTFTMTAFAPAGRHIRLHGTKGMLRSAADELRVDVHTYADGQDQRITLSEQAGGHGGGDDNVMASLVAAARANDPAAVSTTTAESLASHRVVFAAERARREGRVVEISEVGG